MKKYILGISVIFYTFLIENVSALNVKDLNYGNPFENSTSTSYSSGGFDGLNSILGFITILFIGTLVIKIIKNIFVGDKNIQTPNLVVTKLNIDDDNNKIINIEGRKGGIWNFILSKLNIENKYIFLVEKKERRISLDEYGLNGNKKTSISFDSLASIQVGYIRKMTTVIYLGIIIFISMFLSFFVGLVLSIMLGIYYYITKTTKITFETNGGTKLILSYSPSVIEGVNLDIKKGKEIEDIIINLKNK